MNRVTVGVLLLASSCALDSTDPAATPDAGTGSATGGDAGTTATPHGDRDPSGYGDTVATGGIDPANPFFASLGTNGRSCASCHVQATGWSLSPAEVQARFDASGGTDPLFRTVDGATSPDADVSTLAARQAAYGLLLRRAVIRVGRPVPAGAEFALTAADDPYHFASAAELSLFRRPLPATNLKFLSSTMWDAREPSLAQQASDATLGHAQAGSVDAAQMAAIVAFESSLTTAQTYDDVAGALDTGGATGGPAALAATAFSPGGPNAFTLYNAWGPNPSSADAQAARRASIARGEHIFDTRPIEITNVPGLTAPGQTLRGSCSTCHDTSAAGDHSRELLLDLGLTIPNRRTPDMPLYTFTRTSDGTTRQLTDPGYALTTGKWADLGKFKVPVLRALAMRAPFFHDGSARDLEAVVGFYDTRFRLGLSPQERGDLVAFLAAL